MRILYGWIAILAGFFQLWITQRQYQQFRQSPPPNNRIFLWLGFGFALVIGLIFVIAGLGILLGLVH
ncbi:MAG: hypothetical protein ABF743_09620 [Schleiferilactobacillus perolens]|uniref:hypothetical protein n=1 Tax=Schleiferilactobacillus perolens TaxID=100468 RepID=UPI0039EA8E61